MPLPGLLPGLFGHVISGFKHNILGIGYLCDKYCKVLFTKYSVIIYDRNNEPFLKEWRETSRAKPWRISLKLDLDNCLTCHEDPTANSQEEATLEAFSAYDLPSLYSLVIYLHDADGYLV